MNKIKKTPSKKKSMKINELCSGEGCLPVLISLWFNQRLVEVKHY